MENASNALVMAGSVLIGVILLTTMVFVFRLAGDFAKSVDEDTQAQIIETYNEKFETFIGKQDITIHDIVSIINYAEDCNDEAGRMIIDVKIDNMSKLGKSEQEKIDMLQDDKNIYACKEVEYNSDTKMIKLIKFNTFQKKS